MRRTQVFTKTNKTVPADETALNAKLLIQAGYVYKQMAGVYAFLPLGKRVLDKIVQIIREEMNAIGGNELSMTALQPAEPWKASGRWSEEAMDVWFKTDLASGSTLGLAPTHEEPITQMMTRYIASYKDLPAYPYQFQIKFRNELRAKSGLMRGREFLMKDLYSFCRDREAHDEFYAQITEAYHRIYERLGLGDITFKTFASGGSFAKYSHEFQTLSPVGEDVIYVHRAKRLAINKEVYNDQTLNDLGVTADELEEATAVEVGNIFTLGTRFSEAEGLYFTDEKGERQPVFMGSYGIGPSRVMGLLAEHFADEKGLVWPESVAPFKVNLTPIDEDSMALAEDLYAELEANGIEVLFDDRRGVRAGEKFADSDLMGLPYRIVISKRLIEQNKFELVHRASGQVELIDRQTIINKLK